MKNDNFENKKIAILGLGIEGIALANYLSKKSDDITLLDQNIEEELLAKAPEGIKDLLSNEKFSKNLGDQYLSDLKSFDIIFRSPGIPFLNDKIQEALESGVEISSQIKLFFHLCPSPIIGVTGTKGKGTTASLILEMLNNSDSDRKVYLAGNIGEPAIKFVDNIKRSDVVILELSSFQLQDLDISPHIAVITNLSSDHLDYHKDTEEYRRAKEPIAKYQKHSDFAVVNQDYLTAFELVSNTAGKVLYFSGKNSVDQGAYVRKCQISNSKCQKNDKAYEVVLRMNDKEEVICRSDEVKLVGKHNLENIAAAAVAAFLSQASIENIRDGAKKFNPLPHRLEFVSEIDGKKFYNDSFATNPEPTMAAIDSFAEDKILILGGSSKGADFSTLAEKISASNVSGVILIGDESESINSSLKNINYSGHVIEAGHDLILAISESLRIAKPNDIIIFSPACASFDMFKNYKDRGNKFKEAVIKIK